MADKDDDKSGRPLDDIEREVDAMENAEAGGEAGRPFIGAESEDVEVVLAPEDDQGEPNLDELNAPIDDDTVVVDGEPVDEPAKEAGDDKEVAGYSQRVRDRISREIRLRKTAEIQAEAERQGRISAQTQLQSTQLNAAEITLTMVDSQIKDKETALKIAKDGGKVDDDIKLTGELSELRARKTEVERVRDHLKATPPPQPNPLVHGWERQNRWFDNPEFLAESAAVRTISKQLAQKFPPNTPEHFAEVDKELQRRMPNLAARVKARMGQDAISWGEGARRQANTEPRRQAPRLASPGPGFGKASPSGKRQIVLTRTDIESMRNVRLDPNNKSHVLQFAREKEALARSR